MEPTVLSEDARTLLSWSKKLFDKKKQLHTLWQEIAENFYPERADFTYRRSLGDEFAEHLMDSFPVLVRRDLGNSITSMLRPANKDWGEMTIRNEDMLDNASRRWLEWAWQRQRQYMYDRASNFTRATKEGDHDFAAFGQAVIHVGYNRARNGLLYTTHHLRDCAWAENEEGFTDQIFVKRRLPALQVYKLFKGNVHPKVAEYVNSNNGKDRLREVEFQHVIVPVDMYPEAASGNLPYVSLYIDTENEYVMEALASRRKQYVIPRWQTVSGSQYAYSPASITALPDARLIQAMTLTLLEAGEKYVNPPIVAVEEAVRSDVALYAGGLTWVDSDYDERLGAALRPLTQDKSGMPIGFEMSDRQKAQITEAFYLNKIAMPRLEKEATAFEVGQLVQEYIRQALPLFEPLEYEYNGGLCEETFDLLFWGGVFGSPLDVPERLLGADIEFKFRSPLHDAEGKEKGQRILEVSAVLEPLMALDPTVASNLDIHSAFRDALEGMDVPSKWLLSEEDAAQVVMSQKQEMALRNAIETAGGAAEVARTAGQAGQEINNAQQQEQA